MISKPPALSRRGLLAAGAAAGAAIIAPARPALAAPGLVDSDRLWRWNELLAAKGPRLTGNNAHRFHVDWLEDQLREAGLQVQRDRLTFDQWLPRRWSLSVAGEPVDVAFYFPYSGSTPPGGVTAPLIHLGSGNLPTWSLARGKIAVVEVPVPPLPITLAFLEQGRYPEDAASPSPFTYQPGVSDLLVHPDLKAAAAAGVLGVVCVRTGISDELAADQYSPFTSPYQGCPGLWVGPTAGEGLRRQALLGATATFTLEADMVHGAASDTLWAVLPGSSSNEAVVVNTHTDGPNVAEENGGLGIVSLARRYAALPQEDRRRSLVFVLATGHFQLPQFAVDGDPLNQASSRWMEMHPEYLDGTRMRTVAALTLEHLGCREWLDDATHTSYGPTGLNEVGWCYTTTPTMRDVYLRSAQGTANTRTIAAQPAPHFYFGEGAPFYKAGIATTSLIPAQSYLVAAPQDGALSKLDRHLMSGQIQTFDRVIARLEGMSAAEIGQPTGI